MHARQPVGVELAEGLDDDILLRFKGSKLVRHDGEHVGPCAVADDAVRFAVLVVLDVALNRRPVAAVDAAELQRHGVGGEKVQAVTGEEHRMVGAGLVQIPAGRHGLAALKLLVVESDAEDPFARGHVFCVVVQHLLELLERGRCLQIELGEAACISQKMLMRIDHAGQHCRAMQIDHFVGELLRFLVTAAVNEFAVLHNEGRALIALALHCINSTVHIGCRVEHFRSSSFFTDVQKLYILTHWFFDNSTFCVTYVNA